MHDQVIMALTLLQCVLPVEALEARHKVAEDLSKEAVTPTIVVTKVNLRDKTLELSYEIRNDTNGDLWIMEGLNERTLSTAVFMDDDNQTLLLRSRLDVPPSSLLGPPQGPYPTFEGTYVRLPSGERLSESVSLSIPVRPQYWIPVLREERRLEHATRLAIEIGYHKGDLFESIRNRLVEEAKVSRKLPLVHPNRSETLFEFFDGMGLLKLNEMNERLWARNERILLPYTGEILKGEESFRVTVDDVRIPYVEEELYALPRRHDPPNLNSCTKIEIEYRPSILDYYFPLASMQRMLSDEEMRRLKATRTVVVEDKEDLKSISDDVGKGVRTITGAIRQRTVADLVCYRGNKSLLSFQIYNHLTSLVDSQGCLFSRQNWFQSIGNATPNVRPIQLRLRCADNLKDLWHRLRLFNQAEKHRLKESSVLSDVAYPESSKWCDAVVTAYKSIGMLDYWIKWMYRCPSVLGRCHYAINPNCTPDSPANVVLLFETEDGWNQHGGPELFTFDNHNPKGGCVLLNDGTVRFIHTKEELQKLRWK